MNVSDKNHHINSSNRTKRHIIMLWRKESNKENALYEDIFVNNMCLPSLTRAFYAAQSTIKAPTIVKSDAKSLEKRTEGNKRFGKSEWAGAMENYSESLCLATPGSPNISLAYANRSACFLHLKVRCIFLILLFFLCFCLDNTRTGFKFLYYENIYSI